MAGELSPLETAIESATSEQHTMPELMKSVLLHQLDWSSQNTPIMQERGQLIRHGVAPWLRNRLDLTTKAMSNPVDDLRVEARDGTGLKNEIPWVRVHSVSRSPSATAGWYVVYLFGAQGDRVYLSLMQGTTRWENGEFHPRPVAELRERVQWARRSLGRHLARRPDLIEEISLKARGSKLGPAYEAGSVAAFDYLLDDIPSEVTLEKDLQFLVSVLGHLYQLEEQALDLPGSVAPEVVDALITAERSAGRRRKGQGLRLNVQERIAIEQRAVEVAMQYLRGEGFKVKDVGATESYDIDARIDRRRVFVEVKGTTSPWNSRSEVILTKNEVELHEREYPNTMLLVVTDIALDRKASSPVASGGVLHVLAPWRIEQEKLIPIAYRYLVGAQGR